MGKLEVYNSIKEKDKYFNQITVTTKNEFDQFYLSLSNPSTTTSIWRGACEAKHKIYNSLQRFWISNELNNTHLTVIDFLKQNLKFASKWKNNVIEKAFATFCRIETPTVYSILSILRHHGVPSPFIDFSRNAKIALFFACEPLAGAVSDEEIDHYFSIYEIKEDHVIQAQNIKEMYLKFWPTQRSFKIQLEDLLEGITDANKVNTIAHKFTAEFCQELLIHEELFFKQFKESNPLYSPLQVIEDKKGDILHYFINTHFNIVNQEGLFVMNIDPVHPLETVLYKWTRDQGQEKGISVKEFSAAFDRHKQNFLCYNVHKSLKRYALKKLANDSINHSYVYPDLLELAKSCENDFLENL
jgi:hypothetical protein